jgi:hypothetical protein
MSTFLSTSAQSTEVFTFVDIRYHDHRSEITDLVLLRRHVLLDANISLILFIKKKSSPTLQIENTII